MKLSLSEMNQTIGMLILKIYEQKRKYSRALSKAFECNCTVHGYLIYGIEKLKYIIMNKYWKDYWMLYTCDKWAIQLKK